MAKTKRAPIEGPNGVDRWSCNGYGLTLDGKPVEPPPAENDKNIDEIEEIEE